MYFSRGDLFILIKSKQFFQLLTHVFKTLPLFFFFSKLYTQIQELQNAYGGKVSFTFDIH